MTRSLKTTAATKMTWDANFARHWKQISEYQSNVEFYVGSSCCRKLEKVMKLLAFSHFFLSLSPLNRSTMSSTDASTPAPASENLLQKAGAAAHTAVEKTGEVLHKGTSCVSSRCRWRPCAVSLLIEGLPCLYMAILSHLMELPLVRFDNFVGGSDVVESVWKRHHTPALTPSILPDFYIENLLIMALSLAYDLHSSSPSISHIYVTLYFSFSCSRRCHYS